MKKLNITKEQFNRSRYFKNKYGKLEYVSESGRLFKTNKGKVLMFKEDSLDDIPFRSHHGDKLGLREVGDGQNGSNDEIGMDAASELIHERFLELDGDNGQQKKLEEKEQDFKYCFDILEGLYEGDVLDKEQTYILMSILFDHLEELSKFKESTDETQSFVVNEAIPKTLKEIPQEQAERLIQKHLRAGTGEWEGSPGYSDFIYEIGGGRYKLIRPGFGGRYETGIVSM